MNMHGLKTKFFRAPVLICLKLLEKDFFINELALETGLTYAHTWNIIDQLENYGIVRKSRSGKRVMIKLTEDGRELASYLKYVINIIDSIEERR